MRVGLARAGLKLHTTASSHRDVRDIRPRPDEQAKPSETPRLRAILALKGISNIASGW